MSIFCNNINADTLYLKNNRSIAGVISNEDPYSIELEVCSGSVKFKREEINRIERGSDEANSRIRNKCARQKIEGQTRLFQRQLEEEQKPKNVEFLKGEQTIILPVILNKRVPASLVLDTGSSLVVLRKSVAEKLGINLNDVNPNSKLVLADGRKVDTKFIILESITAQGAEAKNVQAAIMLDDIKDAGFQDGLLGMSFLKQFNFKVDYKDKKLVLEKL